MPKDYCPYTTDGETLGLLRKFFGLDAPGICTKVAKARWNTFTEKYKVPVSIACGDRSTAFMNTLIIQTLSACMCHRL